MLVSKYERSFVMFDNNSEEGVTVGAAIAYPFGEPEFFPFW